MKHLSKPFKDTWCSMRKQTKGSSIGAYWSSVETQSERAIL